MSDELAKAKLDSFPAIKGVFVSMSGYNGGINRDRPEESMLLDAARWFLPLMIPNLAEIDEWLSKQTEGDLLTICDGEEEERDALLKKAPPLTEDLLDAYFNSGAL